VALKAVHVRIDTLRVPAHSQLDRVELQQRVELELAALLRRMPVSEQRAGAGTQLELGSDRVPVAASATGASVAYALARHIHAALSFGGARG
jgi:hypothetical protein